MRRVTLLLLSFVFVPCLACAAAIDARVRINGPLTIAATETSPPVAVVNGDAIVAGVVEGMVVVVNGRAEVHGTVHGDVVVFGDAVLGTGSHVTGAVTVYGGALLRAEGAAVDGPIRLEQRPVVAAPAPALIYFWIAALVLGGTLLLTLVAWRPLTNSASIVLAHPFHVLAIGAIVALSVPAAAIAILPTGIGVLLGLAVLICVIPAAIFCGFTVAAMAIGDWIAAREPHLVPARPHTRALAEAAMGAAACLIVLLVPVFGVAALLVVSTMGVGALVTRAWTTWSLAGHGGGA